MLFFLKMLSNKEQEAIVYAPPLHVLETRLFDYVEVVFDGVVVYLKLMKKFA